MDLPEIINLSLAYIEQNLKTEITTEELAEMAGYSTWHFCRLFSSVTHSSVTAYILKRRLDRALAEMAEGKKAVDVVLQYGFDTYAGFYKAFVKIYGCSPKKYLSIYPKHKPQKTEAIKMYTEKELRKTLENWDIDNNLPIRDIYIMNGAKASGTDWTVGDDYSLRTGSRDALLRNIKVLLALNRQGFASSKPVPTKTGGAYLDNGDIFFLAMGSKGKALSQADRFGDDRKEYGKKFGKSIAGLHKALKEVQGELMPDDMDLYHAVTEFALPNVRQQNTLWDMGLTDAFFTDYEETFKKLYPLLPRQLIHRDPHPGNILFENGEVTGFQNFDLSEVNLRLWDVCYCATGILSEGHDRGL